MTKNDHREGLLASLMQASFQGDSGQGGHLNQAGRLHYLTQHIDRFWKTTNLVDPYLRAINQPKILDIGSFPYYGPLLYHLRWQANVVGVDMPEAGYWAGISAHHAPRRLTITSGQTHLTFLQYLFNIERERLPFQAEFDAVFFTEILEHLLLQPHVALEQIHRCLKPGGLMVLTTPNAHYAMKLLAILRGTNINEPYNLTIGVYGRHNREYLLGEVCQLLEAHHFRLLEKKIINFPKPHLPRLARFKYGLIDALTQLPGLGRFREGLVVIAQKHGPSVATTPSFLFRTNADS